MVVPDSILRIFIQAGFALAISGFQRVGQIFIHLRIAVERGIEDRWRLGSGSKQRR